MLPLLSALHQACLHLCTHIMLLQRASQTIILFDPQINLGAREAMHHLPSFSQEKTDSER